MTTAAGAEPSGPARVAALIDGLSTRDLLRLYAAILAELGERKVVRSRNAPAGDLAEELVRVAYDGTLAPPSAKSWDVLAGDGRRLQVKCRVVDLSARRAQTYSPFRTWDFDECIFIVLDATTYDVLSAHAVAPGTLREMASVSAWVNGSRVTVAQVRACTAATDVTTRLVAAFDDLPGPTRPSRQ